MGYLISSAWRSCNTSITLFLFLNLVSFGNSNAIHITPAPPEPTYRAELAKRQIDTWGYISGDSISPLTCPQSYTRTYDGDGNDFLACCNAVTCHNDWHLCVPYGGTGCPYPSICSNIYGAYTSCGQALPGCMTYFLPTVSGPDAMQGITSYDCGPTETVIRVLTSVTGAQPAATSTSADSISLTSNQASSPSQTSNPASSNSGSSVTSSHPLSTGEIVGIVVGGIIGIIILAVVLFFCLRWIFRQCCGSRPRGGESSYGGSNYEMQKWLKTQQR